MKTLSKRWLVGAGALVIAAAVAVAVSQADGGSGGRAIAQAAEPQSAATGLGQLSGQLPREKLTLESAIQVDLSKQTVRLPIYKGKADGTTVW
jgi:hypothetical protein